MSFHTEEIKQEIAAYKILYWTFFSGESKIIPQTKITILFSTPVVTAYNKFNITTYKQKLDAYKMNIFVLFFIAD